MSRFAKVIILVVLFFGFMLLLTFVSPSIRQYATELARGSRLPLWVVGLAAPILLVFQKIGDLVRGIFGESGTEKAVRESNEAIKVRLAEVESDVQRLDDWRTKQISSRLERIDNWEGDVGRLRERKAALDEPIADLVRRDQEDAVRRQSVENEVAALRQEFAELQANMIQQ